MLHTDLAGMRLHQQQLIQTGLEDPAAMVGWFGAMQAQDYANVRWALGVRLPGTADQAISAAIDDGKIIRTHILRPTWHLVAAADLRWMLALSGPRVSAQFAGNSQRLGLTADVFQKSHKVLEKALQGGKARTRTELVAALAQAGIHADALQATHLMMQAELDGLVCNGAMQGKQFTYALLDERVPYSSPISREEAVARLVQRYFQSHGPATFQDFVWWSGLTLTDTRAGMEAIRSGFVSETIQNQTYWMPANLQPRQLAAPDVHLLPSFDEFIVAYKNRDASLPAAYKNTAVLANGIFKPVVVLNGQVVGTWQRTLKKDHALVEVSLFSSMADEEKAAIEAKTEVFGRFLGLKTSLQFSQ